MREPSAASYVWCGLFGAVIGSVVWLGLASTVEWSQSAWVWAAFAGGFALALIILRATSLGATAQTVGEWLVDLLTF